MAQSPLRITANSTAIFRRLAGVAFGSCTLHCQPLCVPDAAMKPASLIIALSRSPRSGQQVQGTIELSPLVDAVEDELAHRIVEMVLHGLVAEEAAIGDPVIGEDLRPEPKRLVFTELEGVEPLGEVASVPRRNQPLGDGRAADITGGWQPSRPAPCPP
jgi:hypothetical protein